MPGTVPSHETGQPYTTVWQAFLEALPHKSAQRVVPQVVYEFARRTPVESDRLPFRHPPLTSTTVDNSSPQWPTTPRHSAIASAVTSR